MRFEARPEAVTPLLRRVEALHRAGREEAACAAWTQAVALHPDSLTLLRMPADMATERGDHVRAGEFWTQALERSDRHPTLVSAALAAAWHAGPALRAAGKNVIGGGYFAPSPDAQL